MASVSEELQGPPKLFAADLWPVFNFGDPNERYKTFLGGCRPAFKILVDAILLHEEIVVPTQDFMSLTVLVDVLGERQVLELLEAGCLKFFRLEGGLAYVGQGIKDHGIQPYTIGKPGERLPVPFCGPLEDAVAWALAKFHLKEQKLANSVLKATSQINVNTVGQTIRRETHRDILGSPDLGALFGLRNRHLDKLSGIEPNGVRIYGGPENKVVDDIDSLMLLTAANTELRLSEIAGCSDCSTGCPTGHLIKAKAERALGGDAASQVFASLRALADIPDIGEGVLTNQIPIDLLIQISTVPMLISKISINAIGVVS